ncbi:hypothetical protein, partial [Bacillus mycoides]|uniref:hypothetical protein n=1 Tax=Bacillus mycoides TaxID=1405 RepID=UPI0019D5D743
KYRHIIFIDKGDLNRVSLPIPSKRGNSKKSLKIKVFNSFKNEYVKTGSVAKFEKTQTLLQNIVIV